MGLLGNVSRNTLGVGRRYGGVDSTISSARRNRGEWYNFIRQSMDTAIEAYIAFPSGGYPPSTYYMAIKSGGLSARVTDPSVTLSFSIAGGKNATADLTGSGTVSNALLGLIVSMIASLTGSGTISSATRKGIGNLVSALTASGAVSSATRTALGNVVATINGSGSVTNALLVAKGFILADINVTGDVLTSANVGSAVWTNFLVETGLSMEDAMKLITAALAGKVSGAGGTTVTIKNAVAADKNRIVATVDANGNRTAITYDLTD